MKKAAIWGAASLFVLWAGCGIDATVFTSGEADVTEDDGGTSTGTGDGGGSSSIVVGTGGTNVSTVNTTSGGGVMVSSSSAGGDSTTTVVTSTSVGTGGGQPTGFSLDCGMGTVCPGGGQNACCWDNFQVQQGPQGQCVNGPPTNDMCFTQVGGFETRIECQRTSDCGAGLLCCASRVQTQQGSYYDELTCEATCNFPDIQVCENEMDSMNCPQLPLQGNQTVQGECQQSDLLPDDYIICGYPD